MTLRHDGRFPELARLVEIRTGGGASGEEGSGGFGGRGGAGGAGGQGGKLPVGCSGSYAAVGTSGPDGAVGPDGVTGVRSVEGPPGELEVAAADVTELFATELARGVPRRGRRCTVRTLLLAVCALAGCAGGPGRGPAVPLPFQFEARVQVRIDAWAKLSAATEGTTVESKAADDVPVLIRRIFDQDLPEGPVDVVFVVDTTGSMHDDVDAVKRDMRAILEHLRARNPDYRVGVVAYRDIYDPYLTRTHATLTSDDLAIDAAIDRRPRGHRRGRLARARLRRHPHRARAAAVAVRASQHIILMGDAPPHDDYANDPRTLESVTAEAREHPLHVRIHTIGIRCDRECEDALAVEAKERAAQGRVIP